LGINCKRRKKTAHLQVSQSVSKGRVSLDKRRGSGRKGYSHKGHHLSGGAMFQGIRGSVGEGGTKKRAKPKAPLAFRRRADAVHLKGYGGLNQPLLKGRHGGPLKSVENDL